MNFPAYMWCIIWASGLSTLVVITNRNVWDNNDRLKQIENKIDYLIDAIEPDGEDCTGNLPVFKLPVQ